MFRGRIRQLPLDGGELDLDLSQTLDTRSAQGEPAMRAMIEAASREPTVRTDRRRSLGGLVGPCSGVARGPTRPFTINQRPPIVVDKCRPAVSVPIPVRETCRWVRVPSRRKRYGGAARVVFVAVSGVVLFHRSPMCRAGPLAGESSVRDGGLLIYPGLPSFVAGRSPVPATRCRVRGRSASTRSSWTGGAWPGCCGHGSRRSFRR